MPWTFNPRQTKILRKKLKTIYSPVELKLWQQLRARKLLGLKFRRQHGIGRYIVDFYCDEKKLIIEVDGESHVGMSAFKEDKQRQLELEELGFIVLRVSNADVWNNIEEVLQYIEGCLKKTSS